MTMVFKRNKEECFYFCDNSSVKIKPEKNPHGPFDSCGNCKYASHGFLCYMSEGVCLRNNYKNQEDTNCEFSK